jgi:hypothetical protein
LTTTPVAAGQSSTVLEIQTDATGFTNASALVANESQESSNLATFGPVAATPEPVSILLVGGGLFAIAQLRRPRNRYSLPICASSSRAAASNCESRPV